MSFSVCVYFQQRKLLKNTLVQTETQTNQTSGAFSSPGHHESADGAAGHPRRPVGPAVQKRMRLLWQRCMAGPVLQVLAGRVPAGPAEADPGRLGLGGKVRAAAEHGRRSNSVRPAQRFPAAGYRERRRRRTPAATWRTATRVTPRVTPRSPRSQSLRRRKPTRKLAKWQRWRSSSALRLEPPLRKVLLASSRFACLRLNSAADWFGSIFKLFIFTAWYKRGNKSILSIDRSLGSKLV